MANCREVETSLTAYVDGECSSTEKGTVDAHLAHCPQCRMRVESERAAHQLLRSRCADLRGCAPKALRQRCAAQRGRTARPTAFIGRRPWISLSVAATLVLAIGVFVLFGWGSTVETYAAQLAADHVKCFQFTAHAGVPSPDVLGRDWQSAYGWPLRIAEPSDAQSLRFVGLRRCGSTQGRVAHLMYRWRDQPLSVFVLNDRVDGATPGADAHGHQAIHKLGEQAVVWSDRGRTYAVVARAPQDDLERIVQYMRINTE